MVVYFLLEFVFVHEMLGVFCFCFSSEEETLSIRMTLNFPTSEILRGGGRGFVPVLIDKIIST